VFNLGTGHGFSVKEIIHEIRRLTNLGVPYEEVARRPGDPPQLVAHAGRARSVLGWQPQFSDLPAIVRTAFEWERQKPLTVAA
jgi:UDP-glucose 4-epimerase